VFLLANGIRLGQPLTKLAVHFARRSQPKGVHMIPGRNALHGAKARVGDSARQDHVSIQPSQSRGDLRERHPNLESDPGLFRNYANWSNIANCRNHRVEKRPDLWRLATEVKVEVMPTASM
jgi:hypothetical protein